MEKVKVSREVADFIESYENNAGGLAGWEESLLVQHCEAWATGFNDVRPEVKVMENLSPLQLSKILVYGYEAEKTKEERVLSLYQVLQEEIEEKNLPFDKGAAAGVRLTLKKLGIEIEGVTDDN